MCVNVFVFGCVFVWLDGCEWSRVWVRTCGCFSHCNTWCYLMILSNSNQCLKLMRFIQSLLETTYWGKIWFVFDIWCIDMSCWSPNVITVTSQWGPWRLKSSASGLFAQRLFRRTSYKTSKLHVTGLCNGNVLVTRGFLSQWASNAKNISIWSRHHVTTE